MRRGWQVDSEVVSPRVRRLTIAFAAEPATFHDVFAAWANGDEFVDVWTRALAEVPFEAFNWELPAMVPSGLVQPFECVVVDNPRLAQVTSEPHAFAEHFQDGEIVARFRNLRGDSGLIAPAPDGDYPHLAAFCRTAGVGRVRALWAAVGEEILGALGDAPVWLSTAGLGVYWLHVRLDPRPKYYRYAPYRGDR